MTQEIGLNLFHHGNAGVKIKIGDIVEARRDSNWVHSSPFSNHTAEEFERLKYITSLGCDSGLLHHLNMLVSNLFNAGRHVVQLHDAVQVETAFSWKELLVSLSNIHDQALRVGINYEEARRSTHGERRVRRDVPYVSRGYARDGQPIRKKHRLSSGGGI